MAQFASSTQKSIENAAFFECQIAVDKLEWLEYNSAKDMLNIEPLIQDSQKLTSIFGAWPSFHDAEVLDLQFRRGDIESTDDSPELTVQLRVLEATQPNAVGEGNDILATLRFCSICEFKMDQFDNMNRLFDLLIKPECVSPKGEYLPSYFGVQFVKGSGMGASFRCIHIKVLDVVPIR